MQKKLYGLSFIFVIIDQIIKYVISNNVTLNTSITVIDNFFYLTNVHNDGAAFSILSGNVIFLILMTIISLVVIYFFFIKDKNTSKIETIFISMLLGGIIGNFLDRLIHGYVIDYLETIIFNYHFPIFNFADICIVLGIIGIMIVGIKNNKSDD